MGTSWVNSFEECVNDCDTTAGCVDVSFVWPNACYKKNTLTAAADNGAVWTARKKSSSSTNTGNGGTTTSPSTSLSCQHGASNGAKYTSAKGTFLIECGVDYAYASRLPAPSPAKLTRPV